MARTSVPGVPISSAALRREHQLRDLRFLEELQTILASCGDEQSIYSSAVHRIAAAFDAHSTCLAAYEPIAGTIEIVHQARDKRAWEMDILRQAVTDERVVSAARVVAVPIFEGQPYGCGRRSAGSSCLWGVLGVARLEGDGSSAFTSSDRQTLRAAAARIGAELERRHRSLVDDVLDGLLRKTKPIDVYTHTLRELRRFIRYDHSASVMTMQRGMAQITVRVEKVVSHRSGKETLVDSPRRGRVLRLNTPQTAYLSELSEPVYLRNDGNGYYVAGRGDHGGVAGLWRVLCLGSNGGSEGAVLCYPLIFGGKMLGLLRLAARRPDAFEPIEQYAGLLERFARLLSVTLYRSELYHQSDRQLQAIKEIGRTITEPIPVEEVCSQVLQLALRVLHVQVGVVGLLSEDGRLELIAHQGCTLARLPALHAGTGIAGSVIQTRKSRAVPDVSREPAYVVFNERVASELVAPIIYDREVIGFLDVESFEQGRFREEDEEVITFLEALANQAAIAIKTAQLHREAVERLGLSMAIDPNLTMAGLHDLLIDELRNKIDQLASANDRLAAANRAKSEFLAHMSHDLRGPLNVIVGLANLLTDPAVSATMSQEKRQESLEVIRASGEILGSLIGTILDLSALEAGKVQLSVAPFDAAAAFDYLGAMAKTLAEESLSKLDISLVVDEEIQTINADEDKFLRIMINLISNAVKFTPSGGRIAVQARRDETSGGLYIMVADTGVGIPHEYHESIFLPFKQVEGAAGGQPGTGLGLAVVRQLVELHGGRVWVESELEQGTAFHIVLPYALDVPVERLVREEGSPASVSRQEQPAAPTTDPHSRGLVLVVEDTDAHMNLMRLAVTSRGYAMHGVTSGEEALDWLADHRPDVILLDMQLPGVDGFSVAARVKSRLETHAIPIIAVTADALAANEERALASGVDAYLTKPIDIGILLSAIDSVS